MHRATQRSLLVRLALACVACLAMVAVPARGEEPPASVPSGSDACRGPMALDVEVDALFVAGLRRLGYGQRVGDLRCGTGRRGTGMPGPWFVAVERDGIHCMRPGDALVLWRAAADHPAQVRVATGYQSTRAATWSAGRHAIELPEGLVSPGREFHVIYDGQHVSISTVAVADPPADLNALADFLHARGCVAQALGALRAAVFRRM